LLRRILAPLALSLLLLAAPKVADADSNRVAVMADLGVPDGLTASLLVRAQRHLDIHLGAAHNSFAPGARAGVRLFAVRGRVAPYLGADGGIFSSGEAHDFARTMAKTVASDRVELHQVGYRFGNLQLGLRFGDRSHAFFLQGGVSFMQGTLLVDAGDTMDTETTFTVRTFSGRAGLLAYF
jgi:hypothetical protein